MSSKINSKLCKAARILTDMSQEDLSKHIGAARKTISDFEADKRNTNQRTIRDIDTFFNKIGFEFEDCEEYLLIKLKKK